MTDHERKLMRAMGAFAVVTWFIFWWSMPARAHDVWANNTAVPSWVKAACCGPDDVHHLTPDMVRAMKDGWHIEGVKEVLPYGKELPSEDGDWWVFYKDYPNQSGGFQAVYCFFAPRQGF